MKDTINKKDIIRQLEISLDVKQIMLQRDIINVYEYNSSLLTELNFCDNLKVLTKKEYYYYYNKIQEVVKSI